MAIIQVFLGLRNILVYGTFPEETWEILDLEANLPYMRALLLAVVFATNEGNLSPIERFISQPRLIRSHATCGVSETEISGLDLRPRKISPWIDLAPSLKNKSRSEAVCPK